MTKVRYGFVSNSSSCSFVIKILNNDLNPGEVTCPCCGQELEGIDSVIKYIDSKIDSGRAEGWPTVKLWGEPEFEHYSHRDDVFDLYSVQCDNCNKSRMDLIRSLDLQGKIEIIDCFT